MYVRKNDKGAWERWNGVNEPFEKMIAVCDIHYHDGRIERDRACEPYPVEVQLSANEALEVWTNEELAEVGLARAAPRSGPRLSPPSFGRHGSRKRLYLLR